MSVLSIFVPWSCIDVCMMYTVAGEGNKDENKCIYKQIMLAFIMPT